jgi:hypothetical protein
MIYEVRTQEELEAAIQKATPLDSIHCIGDGRFTLWGNSHAEFWGNSHAELWENSHAVLWGNSHAELGGNSHAELWENSHAVLRGNSHAVLKGNSTANASKFAALHILSDQAQCSGGVQIRPPKIETIEQWCDFYGVEIKDGVVVLYKALGEDFKSPHGFDYSPGTIPIAPDWDGGKRECGGGLHFSPSPGHALAFNAAAKRFCACPIAIVDLAVTLQPSYPEKVKGHRCFAPVYEVDIDRKRVTETP